MKVLQAVEFHLQYHRANSKQGGRKEWLRVFSVIHLLPNYKQWDH